MELWAGTPASTTPKEPPAEMLTVVMDVAPEQFTVSPLLLVLMVAAIALVAVVFLLRFRRKKDK